MPVGTFEHRLAFDHRNYIVGFIGSFEDAVVAVELIKWNVENALRWPRIHGKRLEHVALGSQLKIRLVTRDIMTDEMKDMSLNAKGFFQSWCAEGAEFLKQFKR